MIKNNTSTSIPHPKHIHDFGTWSILFNAATIKAWLAKFYPLLWHDFDIQSFFSTIPTGTNFFAI